MGARVAVKIKEKFEADLDPDIVRPIAVFQRRPSSTIGVSRVAAAADEDDVMMMTDEVGDDDVIVDPDTVSLTSFASVRYRGKFPSIGGAGALQVVKSFLQRPELPTMTASAPSSGVRVVSASASDDSESPAPAGGDSESPAPASDDKKEEAPAGGDKKEEAEKEETEKKILIIKKLEHSFSRDLE